MPNTIYSNFFLTNEISDQFNSHLDLQRFFKVDNTLEGQPGMTRKINVYAATNGVEIVTQGNGNTQSIEVGFTPKTYTIKTAQGRFEYYDEEELTDPVAILTGVRHLGTAMFNQVNSDVYTELTTNATQTITGAGTSYGFDIFADAVAMMNIEGTDNDPKDVNAFAFVRPSDMAALRKALKDELKYVEAFARAGYVGTVAGVNLYTKKDATAKTIVVATKDAVTMFNKKGIAFERYIEGNRSAADANIRKNTIFVRKYYIAALTDATKAVKIVIP